MKIGVNLSAKSRLLLQKNAVFEIRNAKRAKKLTPFLKKYIIGVTDTKNQ